MRKANFFYKICFYYKKLAQVWYITTLTGRHNLIKICRLVSIVTRCVGHCLKALEYILFCTIRYTEFWSLFENAKICVVSYHMLHGVLVFV